MKVLLAVDQSQNSSSATKFVGAIRLPPACGLYLLHVSEPKNWPMVSTSGRSLHLQEQLAIIRAKMVTKASQLVNRLAVPFREQGLEVHPIVVEGIPGAEILTAIEHHKIDLVVLGTKGQSGMKRFLLGSVSEWVLHDAPCSVLVVRGRPRWAAPTSSRGLHILLATDGSTDSQKAATLLKTLDFPRSSRLTILHVVEKHSALVTLALVSADMDSTKFAEDIRQTGRQAGELLLEETRHNLMKKGLEVDTKLAEGHAAEEILKAAKKVQADFVVVGSKGLTGLRRIMLGSVSNKVVRHAPCSVLVVRKLVSGERES